MFIKNRYISIVYKWLCNFVGKFNTGVSRLWLPLITSCLVATSCSSMLFGYDALPPVAKYQLNKYFDLTSAQQELAERHLEAIFDWHRKTQLKSYAAFLNQVTDKVSSSSAVTVTDVQRWRTTVQDAWLPFADKVSGPLAELVMTLSPQQIERLKKRFKEGNQQMKDDYVKRDEKAARFKARATRIQKRAEFFLDDLSADQEALVVKRASEGPDSEEAWFDERLTRQQSFLNLIEQLRSRRPDAAQAESLMRAYLRNVWVPKDSKNAQIINESTKASDETSAILFSTITAEQKAYAVAKFKGYASDFERLSARRSP
jgi:Family of unknown function (DUF6279)